MKPRFSDVRDRLRFVVTTREDYDLSSFPDFLIIGPQRTGTTWLERVLGVHPEVHFAPGKELYYFNNLEHRGLHRTDLPPIEEDLGWYLDKFTIPVDVAADRAKECRERFGCAFTPKIAGEGTASYAAMVSEAVIEEILILNPDIKVITMVRDPVDRAWSHAKKGLCRDRNLKVAEVPESEWMQFFNRPYQVACGMYTEFIARWRKHLPEDQLFVGRFRDIAAQPHDLLTQLFGFLDISSGSKFWPEVAAQQINPTESTAVPEAYRMALERLFADETVRLRDQNLL